MWRCAVIAILAAALCAPASAGAAVATVRDPRGDAKAPWDFTRVRVSNGERLLRVRLRYRGSLRTGGGFLANVGFDLAPRSSQDSPDFTADLLVDSRVSPDRRRLVRDDRKVRCRGFSIAVRARRGVIDITVPQRCLGSGAGRVRIDAYSYRVKGAADEADYLDGYSRWVRRG